MKIQHLDPRTLVFKEQPRLDETLMASIAEEGLCDDGDAIGDLLLVRSMKGDGNRTVYFVDTYAEEVRAVQELLGKDVVCYDVRTGERAKASEVYKTIRVGVIRGPGQED